MLAREKCIVQVFGDLALKQKKECKAKLERD